MIGCNAKNIWQINVIPSFVKSSWIYAIPDRPEFPTDQGENERGWHDQSCWTLCVSECCCTLGRKKRLHNLWEVLSTGSKFMSYLLPIFEEQIRIYNAKRLWDPSYGVSTKKLSKHLTVFSAETVNIKQLANLINSKR